MNRRQLHAIGKTCIGKTLVDVLTPLGGSPKHRWGMMFRDEKGRLSGFQIHGDGRVVVEIDDYKIINEGMKAHGRR